MHIENLFTLISASTQYNNHIAGGLVNGKPAMNITLALGFRLNDDDIICNTNNESLTHQQDALFSQTIDGENLSPAKIKWKK